MASNLVQLVSDVIAGLDETVDLIKPLVDTLVIDEAEGVWLDTIAIIVGAPARTKDINNNSPVSDVEYRKRIYAQIELNNAGSTNQAIATAVNYYLVLKDEDNWDFIKTQPVTMSSFGANVYIQVDESNSSFFGEVKKYIPVGVGMYILSVPSYPFVVDDLDDPNVDPNSGGCGTLNDLNVGGELAKFIDINTK